MHLCTRITIGILLLSTPAHAVVFSITNRSSTLPGVTDPLANALENIVNQTLFSPDQEEPFLRAMGNANAAATRSRTDPINEWEKMSISLQAAAALETPRKGRAGAGARTNAFPSLGLGAQAGLSIGLPPATLSITDFFGLDLNRLKFYGNWMLLKLKNVAPGTSLNFATFGAMAQYQWIEGSPSPHIAWSGIALSSGLQFSHFSAVFRTPLNLTTGGSGITMSYLSTVDLRVDSNVLTVPFEATTGFTLLRTLSLYTGLGLDLNLGGSELTGGASGPVRATDGGGTEVFTGTGTFDATTSKPVPPTPITIRGLLGAQLSFYAARIFMQASISSPNTIGFLAGLRASW